MVTAAQMGYSESEFWQMTPRFFVAAMRGFERNNREAWERARMIGYLAFAPHIDGKKAKKTGPADIWPLPWDKAVSLSDALARAVEEDPEVAKARAATRARADERARLKFLERQKAS